MKLWTDEDQRLADRAVARESLSPVCRCGHFEHEHGQMRACFMTVWFVKMLPWGVETEPIAKYCPCYEFEAA